MLRAPSSRSTKGEPLFEFLNHIPDPTYRIIWLFMADHWRDFDVHYAKTIELKMIAKWGLMKWITHMSLQLWESLFLASDDVTGLWTKHLRDLKSVQASVLGTYLGCWLVGHFSPGLKPRRINQVSVVNNFHSIYWIWIWIDWFKSQDLKIDVSKDVQAKTHSGFWPLQRKARVFL